MNKRFAFFILAFIIIGVTGYALFTASRTKDTVEYVNSQYGFSFSLPSDWRNYSVISGTWEGVASGPDGQTPVERGPMISIRNPQWSEKTPYQDIPIMVFTLAQWESMQNDTFHIGAAPINPSELGRNASYVFALPARYNYAFPPGWEEVQAMLDAHDFQPLPVAD
jgi:hypothetical protein